MSDQPSIEMETDDEGQFVVSEIVRNPIARFVHEHHAEEFLAWMLGAMAARTRAEAQAAVITEPAREPNIVITERSEVVEAALHRTPPGDDDSSKPAVEAPLLEADDEPDDDDPHLPEDDDMAAAILRLKDGDPQAVVADELGLDAAALRKAWTGYQKAVREAAAPDDGWAACGKCSTRFNAEKARKARKLATRPTLCAACSA